MKTKAILTIVCGFALLVMAIFAPRPSTDEPSSSAGGRSLHEVTGMAFQGAIEPQPKTPGLCCVASGGSRCTPVGVPFSHCQTTILPIILGSGCGPAVVGKWCGYAQDGPWKNDVCTTDGAPPGSECGWGTDGVCAQYRTGTCKSVAVGSFFQCKCDYVAGTTSYNGRTYCVAGSTACP